MHTMGIEQRVFNDCRGPAGFLALVWFGSHLPSVSSTGNTQKALGSETTCSRKKAKTTDEIEDGDEERIKKIQELHAACCKSRVTTLAARR